jgi:ABC-2 type transport system permease protein
MLSLIIIELRKVFGRKRSYIGFLAIFFIVSVLQIAVYEEGQTLIDMMINNLKDTFVFDANLLNGYFVSFLLMNNLWILMPFLVTFTAGDIVAGEAHAGTFRIILTRPVSRIKVITAKYITVLIYTFLLVLFQMMVTLGLSCLIFGTGDLIILKSTLNIFNESEVLHLFLGAFGFAFLGMMVVASLAFLLSTINDNSISPIIGTMAIVIGFTIITNLNFQVFHFIRQFLFTTYISSWTLFFDYIPDWHKIYLSVIVCIIHIMVFYSLALLIFNRKDILT